MNRTGSDGVAPEASSSTPAAIVRIAAVHGAAAKMAGLRSRMKRIGRLITAFSPPVALQTSACPTCPGMARG